MSISVRNLEDYDVLVTDVAAPVNQLNIYLLGYSLVNQSNRLFVFLSFFNLRLLSRKAAINLHNPFSLLFVFF